jgi:hypothetical protein
MTRKNGHTLCLCGPTFPVPVQNGSFKGVDTPLLSVDSTSCLLGANDATSRKT